MLQTIIEDLINKITDKSIHIEKRQFYYVTLLKIRNETSDAIAIYEKEKSRK
jgi:hypothetical protein